MASTSKYIEPIASTTNIDINKTELNYEAIKQSYFEQMAKNKDLLQEPFRTKEKIQEKIKHFRNNPHGLVHFMVDNVDGRDRLYIKRDKWAPLEIIAVEDALDVVLEAHIACDHGNVANTYERLIDKYSVPIFCVEWVLASCNVCSASEKDGSQNVPDVAAKVPSEPIRRGIWRLNIIDDKLFAESTHSSNYLLILKEDSTNFVILRPIFQDTDEFAFELAKLFSEFGFPEKIFVPNMIKFYTKILEITYAINLAAKVPVEEAANVEVFNKDKDEVLIGIRDWMKMMRDSYWDQCCHIVQYKLNTTTKLLTRLFNKDVVFGSPFNLFFKYHFRDKMTWTEPPYYKKN